MSSSPHHRHDGTSPLPLGMEVSAPPAQWKGRDTVWPHDPGAGWSYCVTIPSWTSIPQARGPVGQDVNPTVYFKVRVGVQSPQGVSASRLVLRRFNDFLKLHSALRRVLPRRKLPSPPPKNPLQRVSASSALILQRKMALQDWMAVLLEDLEVARSAPVAAFLELEAAARAGVMANEEAVSEQPSPSTADAPLPEVSHDQLPGATDGSPSGSSEMHALHSRGPSLSSVASRGGPALSDQFRSPEDDFDDHGLLHGSKSHSELAASEGYGSEWEADEAGRAQSEGSETPSFGSRFGSGERAHVAYMADPRDSRAGASGREGEGGAALQEELPGELSFARDLPGGPADGAGLSQGEEASAAAAAAEAAAGEGGESRQAGSVRDSPSRGPSVNEADPGGVGEATGPASEDGAGGAPVAGARPSRQSSAPGGAFGGPRLEAERSERDYLRGVGVVLPADQRAALKQVLAALQRRLRTAAADMEDLVGRLRQESAVKDFLASKVKDLEGELDVTRRRGREAAAEMVAAEREKVMALQWDVEEAKAQLYAQQAAAEHEEELRKAAESQLSKAEEGRAAADLELHRARAELEEARREWEPAEAQARADKKLLAKEVKALRKSLADLQAESQDAIRGKAELEAILKEERQLQARRQAARAALLQEVAALRLRLMDCSLDQLASEDHRQVAASSVGQGAGSTDVMELLTTSDNRIGLLLAEAKLLAQGDEDSHETGSNGHIHLRSSGSPSQTHQQGLPRTSSASRQDPSSDAAVRSTMADILIDNAQLRRGMNSLTRHALTVASRESEHCDEVPVKKGVLGRLL